MTGDTGRRLLDTLPPYEADDTFVEALMQAAGNEFERLETFMRLVAFQLRPQNADDSYGILGLYERLIGLPVETGSGLEARRARVLAAIGRGRREGIGEGWADLINLLLDSSAWVEVENVPDAYEITITVPFESTSFRAGGLEVLLSQITPAHIRVHIIYTDSFLVGDEVGDTL